MRKILVVWVQGLDGPRVRRLLVTGKSFSLLALSSMLFFILLGVAGLVQQQSPQASTYSMRGIAASVSSGFFADMLEMEMPSFYSGLPSESIGGKEIGAFLIRSLTGINPKDPGSMLAAEMPGMEGNDAFLIRKGVGTDTDVGPQDHVPPVTGIDDGEADRDHGGGGDEGGDGGIGEDPSGPDPSATPEPAAKPSTGKSKAVFIYHSHNRESWYPELEEGAKRPDSVTKNITLVGKRLAEKLEERGVGAMHSDIDYPTAIKGYRYELSYKYTSKTVKEALASSDDLRFIFDIHRDSQKRKYTTVDIGGKSYAQVYFIIGHKNPNWKENEALAAQIHEALEDKYPGISRGIWGKSAATGNAEYNQSLSPGSVLIEIGGVENTLEESYRTADALAETIASIYWEDEEVSGKE